MRSWPPTVQGRPSKLGPARLDGQRPHSWTILGLEVELPTSVPGVRPELPLKRPFSLQTRSQCRKGAAAVAAAPSRKRMTHPSPPVWWTPPPEGVLRSPPAGEVCAPCDVREEGRAVGLQPLSPPVYQRTAPRGPSGGRGWFDAPAPAGAPVAQQTASRARVTRGLPRAVTGAAGLRWLLKSNSYGIIRIRIWLPSCTSHIAGIPRPRVARGCSGGQQVQNTVAVP